MIIQCQASRLYRAQAEWAREYREISRIERTSFRAWASRFIRVPFGVLFYRSTVPAFRGLRSFGRRGGGGGHSQFRIYWGCYWGMHVMCLTQRPFVPELLHSTVGLRLSSVARRNPKPQAPKPRLLDPEADPSPIISSKPFEDDKP